VRAAMAMSRHRVAGLPLAKNTTADGSRRLLLPCGSEGSEVNLKGRENGISSLY
jgi:hypothetical protein